MMKLKDSILTLALPFNMQFYKKITLFSILFLIFNTSLTADAPYYLDFKYILNQSDAGKKAQTFLKSKLDNGAKSLKKKEQAIQEEERKIIQQKKVISAEEYKKKITDLRKKIDSLQKERNSLLAKVSEQKSKARTELLKNLNPIIQEYMKEKNIRIVLDKKSILLADENLDITQDIVKKLNSKLKSIKLD